MGMEKQAKVTNPWFWDWIFNMQKKKISQYMHLKNNAHNNKDIFKLSKYYLLNHKAYT